MSEFSVKFGTICEWLWTGDGSINCVVEKIKDESNYNKEQLEVIKRDISKKFIPQYHTLWKKSSRTKKHFLEKNKEWLEKVFIVDLSYKDNILGISERAQSDSGKRGDPCCSRSLSQDYYIESKQLRGVGRPRKRYKDSSQRTKRRRAEELRLAVPPEQLKHALRTKDKRESNICEPSKPSEEYIRNRALGLFMDINLTKQKYITLRCYNKETVGSNNFYPPYNEIVLAKQDCYPPNIDIFEYGAKIKLQSLLDHTVKRIIMSINDEDTSRKFNNNAVTLHCKWGMDGSSGQQIFKQAFSSETSSGSELDQQNCVPEDSSVFIVCFVPLKITSQLSSEVLWQNERPNSTRYCRPIEFSFHRETNKNTLNKFQFYKQEIEKLNSTINIQVKEISCTVKYNMQCTMIDGKTCNVLTGQKSSVSCNVCGASPKEMNNLDLVKNKKCDENTYQFGLSTLHCWIRFMECILHISYNLDFKCSVAKNENKNIKNEKKKKVQDNLRNSLSILVDVVKQGYGSTNDGNTARKFFSNSEITSKATGIDEVLIKKFSVILQVLASGKSVSIGKFRSYCANTAKLFVQLYPWYNMPPSVHKVLIHGADIIQAVSTCVPIGHFSEEALEAGNKIFKKSRLSSSRTTSRKANNEDILHYLLINSDPFITSLRRTQKAKTVELTLEAKSLLEENSAHEDKESEKEEDSDVSGESAESDVDDDITESDQSESG